MEKTYETSDLSNMVVFSGSRFTGGCHYALWLTWHEAELGLAPKAWCKALRPVFVLWMPARTNNEQP